MSWGEAGEGLRITEKHKALIDGSKEVVLEVNAEKN
jgi:hypothetical protein